MTPPPSAKPLGTSTFISLIFGRKVVFIKSSVTAIYVGSTTTTTTAAAAAAALGRSGTPRPPAGFRGVSEK